ncbi:ATP-dependent helicase [Ferroplasma acidarmanus]|uniref:DNA 3'-5' helicase n=1 Tax=Ferroplasma acidarmanus Fer1 TaxID=333146 RepID=S0AP77_FERAC|nr:ATP-dependent DNA helicase [Ferroplasma acidarmanus]AGO59999.1 hypothetical protein FACI_IFERC00001G0019 [Ferroplasma acidarmanus Fer1]
MNPDINLTDEQEKAIAHKSGRLRVIACPGSGKTEVIARRVAKLIKDGEKPEGIVAITFTEKAAEELKTRIRKILDVECPERADFGDMFTGTIHGFALDILRELDPYYRTFDVLEDARRVAYVSKSQNYYRRIGLVRLENAYGLKYYNVISQFLKSVDIMLMEQIDPGNLTNKEFAKCFADYMDSLKEDRYFDFATILYNLVYELKNNPEKINLITHRVRHIIVDEFQDVDKLQNTLLELLSPVTESICVVGDDDQGIYHWRGTDVGLIMNFSNPENSAKCTDVALNTNFRSTRAVVELSRQFIENNGSRLPKGMTENPGLKRKYEEGDIQSCEFENEKDELDFIVSKIGELVGTDFLDRNNKPFSLSLSDFAVLTRTNKWAKKIIDRLDREGIPSVAYSGESIFERPEVEFALHSIAYTFECKIRYGKGNYRVPDLSELSGMYSRIFTIDHFPRADTGIFSRNIAALRKEAEDILSKGTKDYLGDLGLQGFYHRILQAMGADRFDFGEKYNYNLACLSRAISDYESVWIRLRASEVKWFFTFMGVYGKSEYTDPQHQDPSIINAVKILTIHKAKGLEFPVVFVPDFIKPNHRTPDRNFVDNVLYDSERYTGTDEDERRVYYTAFTRSEKYLFMTWSRFPEGGVRPRKHHPFLEELPEKYISGPMQLKKSRSGYPDRRTATGEYSTSYSELTSYLRCPNDFLLRNVYGYNAGVPAGFGYGTNIHNVLNMIHRDYIRNEKVPDMDEVVAMVDRMFHLRYATDAMSDNMKKAAERVVRSYVAEHSKDFSRILETEKRFEFVLGEALIAGQIDLLKKTNPDGSLKEVEIIDFKTEKIDGVYSADYDRQLRYYALACLKSLNLKPQKAIVHHLDDDSITQVDISDVELTKTVAEVGKTVDNILKKKFPPSPESKKCDGCDYRKLCSYRS